MPKFYHTIGLGIGEETKGAFAEWLTQLLRAHHIWRSGGCQAAHHVVRPDRSEHLFAQFGAGTFQGASTLLQSMVVHPTLLFQEAWELEELGVTDPYSMVKIHRDCLVVTPFHSATSRIREIYRGQAKKGTIGMGVGEAVKDSRRSEEISLYVREIDKDPELLRLKVERIRRYKMRQVQHLMNEAGLWDYPEGIERELEFFEAKMVEDVVTSLMYLGKVFQVVGEDYLDHTLAQSGAIVMESSHGVLLHPWYGFVPHTTQVDPTAQAVLETLKNRHYAGQIVRLGIIRSHMSRQGAGPLVVYDPAFSQRVGEVHNTGSDWLGPFRAGPLDLVALRYAIQVCGGPNVFDGLLMSHLDLLEEQSEWPICEAYLYHGETNDLDRYFDRNGEGKIVGIKVHSDTRDSEHYEHQQRLTQLLNSCRPVITTLKSPAHTISLEQVFLDTVGEKLGIPVVATGHGPKASDRKVVPGWEHLFAVN